MTTNMFNGMFGKIAPGMCRLSMTGEIAVKTSNGYKTYNLKKERLTNCSSFVFDIGEDFFFLIPTNKVKKGDIILVNGKPRCVIAAGDKEITVVNYEDSTIDTIVPERHVFMGSTYFYGKIVSLFGTDLGKSKGMSRMMKYMMMSELLKGGSGSANNLMPLMLMSGSGFENMFEGMFSFDDIEDELDETESEDE